MLSHLSVRLVGGWGGFWAAATYGLCGTGGLWVCRGWLWQGLSCGLVVWDMGCLRKRVSALSGMADLSCTCPGV